MTSVSMTSEYRIWAGMKRRCLNPKDHGFPRYGGRGITICDVWRNSFEEFLAHVGPRPSLEHSIDRINNDGNYEPGNVRWATRKEQQQNTRRNLHVVFKGEVKTVEQISKETGLKIATVYARLSRGKPGRSVDAPFRCPHRRMIEFRGETKSVSGWARHLGVKPQMLFARLALGWSVEDVLSIPRLTWGRWSKSEWRKRVA